MAALSNNLKKPALVAVLLAIGASLVQARQATSYVTSVGGQVVTKSVRVASEDEVTAVARCTSGQVASGGGAQVGNDDGVLVTSSAPSPDGRGWEVRAGSLEDEGGPTHTLKVRVMCLRGGVTAIEAR